MWFFLRRGQNPAEFKLEGGRLEEARDFDAG